MGAYSFGQYNLLTAEFSPITLPRTIWTCPLATKKIYSLV